LSFDICYFLRMRSVLSNNELQGAK